MLRLSIYLALLLLTTAAQANLESFQAPWLEIMPAGISETKPHGRGPLRIFFGNTPQGKMIRSNPEECSSLELQREMDINNKDQQTLALTFQNFMNRCEKDLTRFPQQRLSALVKLAEGNYPLAGRENLREIVIHLPYKTQIHGLLAFKDLVRPRPMVILICGSACNLSDSPARFYLTEVFDTMPFNVLVLPSVSGSDFIKDNRGIGLGGFEEGRQTFEIIRLLGGSDSPFRNLISSFHVVGTSLGGNGALFTSAYGSYNNDFLTGPKINSVVGICPVVDLKASLMDLDRNDPTGQYFTKLIGDAVIKNFSYVFGAGEVPTLYKPGHNESVPFIEKYIYPRYKILSQIHDFQLAPFSQFDLNTPEAFWTANNFLNYYTRVTVPTLLFYSKDDFIVSPKVNSEALEKALVETPNSFVSVIHVQQGSHCAMSEIYGEDIVDGAMQKFILAQSPEFDYKSGNRSLDLSQIPKIKEINLEEGEKFFGYDLQAKKGSSSVTGELKVWDPSRKLTETSLCGTWNPYYAFEGCFRTVEFNLPLQLFFPDLKEKVTSKEQAQELTRWLNTRVHILTATDHEPVDTIDFPSVAKWTID